MSVLTDPSDLWELQRRLDKDLRAASRLLGRREVRSLVDLYYQVQEFRKAGANMKRSAESGEPNQVVQWVYDCTHTIERDIQRALDEFAKYYAAGRWAQSITGVGPVISAGLLCHLDIREAATVGHFWRLAGLDPSDHWHGKEKARAFMAEVEEGDGWDSPDTLQTLADKAEWRADRLERWARDPKTGKLTKQTVEKALARRPWNADLKRLCFIAGDCFVKFQNHPKDHYGRWYTQRKEYEQDKNRRGEYADQCAASLTEKHFGKDTDALTWYSGCLPGTILDEDWNGLAAEQRAERMKRLRVEAGQGTPMLPPARIHMRCLRWAVKLFLSHLHHVMYCDFYGREPSAPYPMLRPACGDHRHFIPVPNFPWTDGGEELGALLKG